MKSGVVNVLIFILVISAAIGLFVCNNGQSSSVKDNTSYGIILTSTSRVKNTECVNANGFKLPTTNPAVLKDATSDVGSILEFKDETSDYDNARLTIKIPKDIDVTVQPMLQFEWFCTTAEPTDDSLNVRWEITYIWTALDETSDSSGDITYTNNYNASDIAKGLVETNIQLSGFVAGDRYLQANIARRSDATPDTATAATANILGACLYYTANKLGESL